MAIIAINITQDNIVSSVNLLACHNPLVFIAEVTWSTTAPNTINVQVINGSNITNYSGIYLEDVSASIRKFIFVSDEALRAELDDIEELTQIVDSVINIPNLTKDITIKFDDGIITYSDEVDIIACHAARDFSNVNGAAMVDVYNNESNYYVGAVGQDLYLYWWNDDSANIIDTDDIEIGATASVTAANTRTLIINNPAYTDWINGTSGVDDIWCNVSGSDVIFTAEGGAEVTFSDINLGSSLSSVLSNNGTSTAVLTITLDSNPENQELFEFNFDIANRPTPVGGVLVSEQYALTLFDVGFIRKRIQPTSSGIITETLTIDSVDYTHTVKVRSWCEGDVMLKYVDRNGQYRFMPFTKYYRQEANPKSIGTINELILSLATDTGDKKEIGYTNNNTLTLTASQVNETEKELLGDLYNSNEVYVYLDAKWLRVTVNGDNVTRLSKSKFSDVTLTVQLPKSYNIALL